MNTRKRPNKRNRPNESRQNKRGDNGEKPERNRGKSADFGPGQSPNDEQSPEYGQKSRENWLFGTHAVMAALANADRRCHRLCLTSDVLRRLEPELRKITPPQVSVEKTDRNSISSFLPPEAVHQGIALQCDPLPDPALEDVLARHREGDSILVVLDQITDPHNVGAILRSAAGFGAHAVIMPDRNAPPASGTLAKSASGALELLPLIRVTNLARCLEQLADHDYWRIGLDASAPQTLAESRPGKRTALVMGAEGSGMRRLTGEKCDQLCRLPMVEAARLTSLNVSNAAAVALYELVRA